jgi:uncharacterized cupin superfamily protein
MPNIYKPHFDQKREHPGFAADRAFLGRQAGAERLGASLWVLAPGEAAYPYHYHFVEEEMLVVLAGNPSLRTPEGWRELDEGELISFLPGEPGAHQLTNRSDQPVRILSISTAGAPEIAIYPDSNKVGLRGRAIGQEGETFRKSFDLDSDVDYWSGETAPA